jgi:photosystem II stability/assembly factor-like uncharacterized protein
MRVMKFARNDYGPFALWKNGVHWLIKHEQVTLDEDFPLVADFEVVLVKREGSTHGYEVLFLSQEKGWLTSTLLDDRDLCRKGFEIPLPFDDMDQGWWINIGEKNDFVYIWESEFGHPEKGISRWYKVPKERYLAEWTQAIETSKELAEEETEEEQRLRRFPPGQSLYGVCMLSFEEGWAVGGSFDRDGSPLDGCLLHYTQGVWHTQKVDTPLFALAFASATDGWAVGFGGAMFHYDGKIWMRRQSLVESTLRGICLSEVDGGWAVGDDGVVLRYDGVQWSEEVSYLTYARQRWIKEGNVTVPPPDEGDQGYTGITLYAVVLYSSDDSWIVGEGGHIFHFDGQYWSSMWNCFYHFNSLSSLSTGEWWAVGEKGYIEYYHEDSSLRNGYQLETGTLYAVSMLSPQEGWAFGVDGTIIKFNGLTWEVQPAITSKDLRGSCMLSTDEGWCVGQDNTVLHYLDGRWQVEEVQ